MAGLLGDIYSYGNTLKRKVNGLLADPAGTAQRRALFPEDSYDVPVNQLIIRGLLGQ